MEYTTLGKTGLQVSRICLGMMSYGDPNWRDWILGEEEGRPIVQRAVELGVNFYDTANMYSLGVSEEVTGKYLREMFSRRSEYVLATKVYFQMEDKPNQGGLSRKHIMESVENSLRRFDMDYVDIFFCHRYDNETPTEETVRAIEDLIRQGKVLYWGTSMWEANQIQEAVDIADRINGYRPVVEQPLYNMLDRHVVEGDLEAKLDEHSIGLVVWSPLAGGLLTGKYNDGVPEESRAAKHEMSDNFSEHRIEVGRQITALAQEYGYEPAALALAWAMAHQNVDSVITGATKPEHVESNLQALDVEMNAELDEKIERILGNKPYNSRRSFTAMDELPAL